MMMNPMKDEIRIPDVLKMVNVTILHKRKCKIILSNWRCIFVSNVLRTILMKMIHERTYKKVDNNMTDSQIGARKNKSVRNHLFVLNSIISDVMSSKKKEPIDLNIMDFKQMFDAEQLETVMNALYEAEVDDDLFALIYNANNETKFTGKTPNGLTELTSISKKILQGDVLAPLVSSNMVELNIGKQAYITQNIYMYKGKVAIPPLTMTISACGYKTMKMNQF